MTAPSLASYVTKRPWLSKLLKPVAGWYSNAALYRQMGLKYVHYIAHLQKLFP